jgi:hypothetical protein
MAASKDWMSQFSEKSHFGGWRGPLPSLFFLFKLFLADDCRRLDCSGIIAQKQLFSFAFGTDGSRSPILNFVCYCRVRPHNLSALIGPSSTPMANDKKELAKASSFRLLYDCETFLLLTENLLQLSDFFFYLAAYLL